eukprot:Lithocolla_globosa_v1_NODE_2165_length_2129_cov_3.848120.p3 type:complete len:106 gc:universal NODE_2165_length_2129_cov_3.848120:1017-700(-)
MVERLGKLIVHQSLPSFFIIDVKIWDNAQHAADSSCHSRQHNDQQHVDIFNGGLASVKFNTSAHVFQAFRMLSKIGFQMNELDVLKSITKELCINSSLFSSITIN